MWDAYNHYKKLKPQEPQRRWIMSEERIGDKFLRKLYEKTVNNGTENIDREEIGKEIGVIDVQMDNLVDELTAEGYVKKLGRTKIYLTDDGRKRVEI